MKSDKILIGKDAIMDYIRISSVELFKEWVEAGLPAVLKKRRWYAHADNIDEYFRKITFRTSRDAPEDAFGNGS